MRGVKHHVRLAGGAFGPKDVVPVDEKSKGLRGLKHHVRLAGSAFGPKDVVPVDERARVCGESCTKTAPASLRRAKPCAGRAKK